MLLNRFSVEVSVNAYLWCAQVTSAALEVLEGMASALQEASRQAVSVAGALGSLAAAAGPAMHEAGGLAADLLADRRARRQPFKAREVITRFDYFNRFGSF